MYTQIITPAIKSHFDALIDLYTDCAGRMLDAFQRLSLLKLQLAREMLAETGAANQRLMASRNAAALGSNTAQRITGGSTAFSNYRQGLAELVTSAQAQLAQAAQEHIPTVRRTANAVAEELLQHSRDETARAAERQQQAVASMGKIAEAGTRPDDGGTRPLH